MTLVDGTLLILLSGECDILAGQSCCNDKAVCDTLTSIYIIRHRLLYKSFVEDIQQYVMPLKAVAQ